MGLRSVCQLCGVTFNLARIRRPDEPHSAAWNHLGTAYVQDFFGSECAENEHCWRTCGCRILRRDPDHWPQLWAEHIAGPGCGVGTGYNGHRISVEEMEGSRAVQCLVGKKEGWEVEEGDEGFEIEGDFFLTGVVDGTPLSYDNIFHVVSPALKDRNPEQKPLTEPSKTDEDAGGWCGLPFHPTCFEIFKRVSLLRLGSIDVQGLWYWRLFDDVHGFFEELPRELAVTNGQDGMWHHEPGCEYLAANPVKIPGLPALYKAAKTGSASKSIFPTPEDGKVSDRDPFAKLLAEIKLMIIDYMPAKDIANLRLCTRAVRQLPNILFRRLLLEEMPWMWEVKDMDVAKLDWHNFYFTVKFCRPDLKGLRNRKWSWKDVEEIIRRMEQLRSRGKIGS